MRSVSAILIEAAAVAMTGLGLALAANHFSPRGLELGRNYFPERPVATLTSANPQPGSLPPDSGEPSEASEAPAQPQLNADTALESRLRERGLELARLSEVEAWFHDPGRETEQIIFVDARSRRHYLEGHIPAAYQFDHFYPQDTLAEVLGAALAAQRVIVYCNGGDCEDSEFAALQLRDAGVPADRLRVYAGGLEEWRGAGLPIELGERRSGVLEER